jgi:hypothetical protein
MFSWIFQVWWSSAVERLAPPTQTPVQYLALPHVKR